MLAGMVKRDIKYIGKLHMELFNKVNLPPLDNNIDFHPANFFLNLSTIGSQTALDLKEAPKGRPR